MTRHLLLVLAASLAPAQQAGPEIRFNAAGQLEFPAGYREWVFLASGLGMTYGPARAADGAPPRFDNVFVNPSSYRAFLATGRWPDQTMFVLEIRESATNVSINNGGRTQGAVVAIEASVKDSARFPEKWAYFGFAPNRAPARALPRAAACYQCHAASGALDNTFVQFYPAVFEIAREKGTLDPPKAAPATDPVCGMVVDPAASLTHEHQGKKVRFCSEDCKRRFVAAPANFVR